MGMARGMKLTWKTGLTIAGIAAVVVAANAYLANKGKANLNTIGAGAQG